MAFVAAMNTPLTKEGVKGSDVYTEDGVGDGRVALFQQLVRGCTESYIHNSIAKAFSLTNNNTVLRDYTVMAFQTRDVRGGKGERDVFYHMFFALAEQCPALIKPLLALIPEYGCWVDCWKLWTHASSHETVRDSVRVAIVDLTKSIYFEDQAKLERGEKISLLGKWLPRERSAFHTVAHALADAFYPEQATQDDRWRAYRKGCVRLNTVLKTTEINMCGGTWASIMPGTVPGRLLAKARKAFLNEIVERKGKPRRGVVATGLRHPESADRNACRTHFLEHTKKALSGEVTMKGADVVYPHELARKYFGYGSSTTADEDAMIEAQWRAIRDATASAGGLGRAVAMSDFSGSMSGTPMEVSMALGVLISEITHPAFRDYLIGFDSNPSWISLVGKSTLKEKVQYARHYAQGTSTNFQKACDLILTRLIEHKVPAAEAPTDLIVLTDMGFDEACGGAHVKKTSPWETHVQMIQNSFQRHGYVAPRIVLWNLRAEYKDFHAKAHDDGVVVLSGWSPSLLKAISANGVMVKTPYEGMREILDAPRYDRVRSAFDSVIYRGFPNLSNGKAVA
jgi:hypothetical protein